MMSEELKKAEESLEQILDKVDRMPSKTFMLISFMSMPVFVAIFLFIYRALA